MANVTLNDAFLLVMKSSELTYVKDGKNLIVFNNWKLSKDLGAGKQSLTVIPIKYVEAQLHLQILECQYFLFKNVTNISNKQVVASNPHYK